RHGSGGDGYQHVWFAHGEHRNLCLHLGIFCGAWPSVCRVAGAGRGCRAPTQGRPGACCRQARHWGYSPMKPRVVHIIDRLPPDGAERLLCEVLRYRSDGFDYQVLCLAEGGVFEPVIRAMGVPVTVLDKRRGIDLRLVWRLWRWLRANKPQIVHTHLFTADTWGRLVARLAGVPLVFSTVHSVNSWQGRVHRLVDRTLALFTTRLIACTAQVADKLHDQDGIDA